MATKLTPKQVGFLKFVNERGMVSWFDAYKVGWRRFDKTAESLMQKGLLSGNITTYGKRSWRITDAGRAALGIEPPIAEETVLVASAVLSEELSEVSQDEWKRAMSDPDTRAEMGRVLAAWSHAEAAESTGYMRPCTNCAGTGVRTNDIGYLNHCPDCDGTGIHTPDDEPQDELTALRAENERLRAALRPFAELGEAFPGNDANEIAWGVKDGSISSNLERILTWGDFRKAADALKGN